MTGRIMLLLAALLLAGCANQARPTAWLKPGVRVTLPAPGIAPALQQQQLLTGEVQGKSQTLVVLLNADQQKVELAALSTLGIRLFRITYDARGIHTEQLMPLPQLPPASQVLADVMLSHWPVSAWLPQLPEGWTLRDIGLKRQLRDPSDKLVSEIDYIQRGAMREPVAIHQYEFHYNIQIQPLGTP